MLFFYFFKHILIICNSIVASLSSPSNWYTMPTVFLTTPLMRGAATLSITGPIRAPANGAANGKNPPVCCPFPKYQTPRRIYVLFFLALIMIQALCTVILTYTFYILMIKNRRAVNKYILHLYNLSISFFSLALLLFQLIL